MSIHISLIPKILKTFSQTMGKSMMNTHISDSPQKKIKNTHFGDPLFHVQEHVSYQKQLGAKKSHGRILKKSWFSKKWCFFSDFCQKIVNYIIYLVTASREIGLEYYKWFQWKALCLLISKLFLVFKIGWNLVEICPFEISLSNCMNWYISSSGVQAF